VKPFEVFPQHEHGTVAWPFIDTLLPDYWILSDFSASINSVDGRLFGGGVEVLPPKSKKV
jgi:hypothetical protein